MKPAEFVIIQCLFAGICLSKDVYGSYSHPIPLGSAPEAKDSPSPLFDYAANDNPSTTIVTDAPSKSAPGSVIPQSEQEVGEPSTNIPTKGISTTLPSFPSKPETNYGDDSETIDTSDNDISSTTSNKKFINPVEKEGGDELNPNETYEEVNKIPTSKGATDDPLDATSPYQNQPTIPINSESNHRSGGTVEESLTLAPNGNVEPIKGPPIKSTLAPEALKPSNAYEKPNGFADEIGVEEGMDGLEDENLIQSDEGTSKVPNLRTLNLTMNMFQVVGYHLQVMLREMKMAKTQLLQLPNLILAMNTFQVIIGLQMMLQGVMMEKYQLLQVPDMSLTMHTFQMMDMTSPVPESKNPEDLKTPSMKLELPRIDGYNPGDGALVNDKSPKPMPEGPLVNGNSVPEAGMEPSKDQYGPQVDSPSSREPSNTKNAQDMETNPANMYQPPNSGPVSVPETEMEPSKDQYRPQVDSSNNSGPVVQADKTLDSPPVGDPTNNNSIQDDQYEYVECQEGRKVVNVKRRVIKLVMAKGEEGCECDPGEYEECQKGEKDCECEDELFEDCNEGEEGCECQGGDPAPPAYNPASQYSSPTSNGSSNDKATSTSIIALINKERITHKLPSILTSELLNRLAMKHAKNYYAANNPPKLLGWYGKERCLNLSPDRCMANKLKTLGNFTGKGHEIAHHSNSTHPDEIVKSILKDNRLKAIILNQGAWKGYAWTHIGAATEGGRTWIWFGVKGSDPLNIQLKVPFDPRKSTVTYSSKHTSYSYKY
ncbi:hypothetical protein L0F63_002986 [Massospora cicadina]|nr:hypothetical protein L0F63_002986 [Massospora cicadina]